MYQAAIVEDESDILNYIRRTLIESFVEHNTHVTFDSFSSGKRFLSIFESHYHYDMVFLDIEMPELDGITICRRIREIAPDTLVVFISNKEEMVFQTFEVQPFRFIRKSQFQMQLPALVNAMLVHLNEKKIHMLQILEPSSRDIYSFDIHQILYVEAQRKNCRIVNTTGECILKCKFMDLEAQFADFNFLKPHRSYLVNCKYIFYIGKSSLQLTNHEEIPISRNKLDEIKQQFLRYNTH